MHALGNTLGNIVAGLGLALVGATIVLALTQPDWWQAQSRVYKYMLPVFGFACLVILATSQ
jgi:hypothetical protein